MSAKHTPGPWHTHKTTTYIAVRAQARIQVAQLWKSKRSPDEQEADARLIVAAPDMLSVLKAFSDYVRDEQCATDGAVTYSTTAINHWALLARAAIAKAEGGAT